MSDQESTPKAIRSFTREWFGQLLRAELPLGETFWAGGVGVGLIVVPAYYVIYFFTLTVLPSLAWPELVVMNGILAIYSIVICRVIVITAWRNTTASGYRWVAMALAIGTMGGGIWAFFGLFLN